MEIEVGDKVNVEIIKGGYWTNTVVGRVVKVTEKSYIVRSSYFYQGKKERSFAKHNVSLREKAA